MTMDAKKQADARPAWETEVEILPIKSRLIDFEHPLPGTYLVTGHRAQRGYRLSKFCMSFMKPEVRAKWKEDSEGYMRAFGLTEYEQSLIREQNWIGMIRYGISPFMVFKLSAAFGVGQNRTGAAMRGETYEEFMKTRNVKDAS